MIKMPFDRSKYPDNWEEIREDILLRAGGDLDDPRIGARCEWCNVENYSLHPETGSKVVLTTAHIDDPDPMNCDPDNLAALCQKCHNSHDAPMRAANKKAKERQAQIDAGQLELFEDG